MVIRAPWQSGQAPITLARIYTTVQNLLCRWTPLGPQMIKLRLQPLDAPLRQGGNSDKLIGTLLSMRLAKPHARPRQSCRLNWYVKRRAVLVPLLHGAFYASNNLMASTQLTWPRVLQNSAASPRLPACMVPCITRDVLRGAPGTELMFTQLPGRSADIGWAMMSVLIRVPVCGNRLCVVGNHINHHVEPAAPRFPSTRSTCVLPDDDGILHSCPIHECGWHEVFPWARGVSRGVPAHIRDSDARQRIAALVPWSRPFTGFNACCNPF